MCSSHAYWSNRDHICIVVRTWCIERVTSTDHVYHKSSYTRENDRVQDQEIDKTECEGLQARYISHRNPD
jgi:hypothetical protein